MRRVMAMGVQQTDTAEQMKEARKDTQRKIEGALMDHEFVVEGVASAQSPPLRELFSLNSDINDCVCCV